MALTGKKPERKMHKLEKRLKKATDKHEELDTWGMHDHIISVTLQVRALERSIDCAQRLKYLGPEKHV